MREFGVILRLQKLEVRRSAEDTENEEVDDEVLVSSSGTLSIFCYSFRSVQPVFWIWRPWLARILCTRTHS
jgi:hypothetical protein